MFFRKKTKNFDLKTVITDCMAGKSYAQKQLFEQYYGFAKSIAMRYASDAEEIQEMINDGFLKVFSKLQLYNQEQSFEAWFRTVVVNTCIDYFRKNHSKVGFVDIDELHYLQYDDHLLEKISAEEILGLMEKLPPVYKVVFSMFVVEGFSHADIAAKLGINEGTSRSNLSKAKAKMQEMIMSHTNDIKIY